MVDGNARDNVVNCTESSLDEVSVQAEKVQQNSVHAVDGVEQVNGVTQKVGEILGDIHDNESKVVENKTIIRQLQNEKAGGLRVFDVLNYLWVHWTPKQEKAVKNIEFSSSIREILSKDRLLREDKDFQAKFFGKVKFALRCYVRHFVAVENEAALNQGVELWKIWGPIIDPSGNTQDQIDWALQNPKEYDFEWAKKKQNELRMKAQMRKLEEKFGSDEVKSE